MPEQNTPVPIKYEDIQKGDRIRRTEAIEYTADGGSEANEQISKTYELISRPVPLPTEPGIYLDKDGGVWSFSVHGYLAILAEPAHGWFTAEHMARFAPFTLLRPVPEVAAEVLADIRDANVTKPYVAELPHVIKFGSPDLDAIAAKYGVTP
ncbi:hypothetical protein [Cryobacterium arcticum]|uniref:Uncharacterized protein n=1 Tax=Cryobacterium arcticum TaxID=670052 RepID=A0A1B1BPK9_9MICO|nr:hypothetical protein [Cryobacterium arcticum]ANP74497.1 hypothetical protein PA27867_3575 [Cryobacterium arcticum]